MALDEEFWSDRFHWCALAAGFLAAEGLLAESEYVRRLTYDLYESGAFREPPEPSIHPLARNDEM